MNEWGCFYLKDLAKIVGGATPSTRNPKHYGGKIRWITPKDLSTLKGRYIEKGKRNLTKLGFKSCSTVLLPKHAILFSSRAPIGYVAIAKRRVCTGQGLKNMIANKKVYFEFLYYLIRYNKDILELMGSGTIFRELNADTIGSLKVKIPINYHTQKAIAHVLSILDQKIELNEKINQVILQSVNDVYWHYFYGRCKNGTLEDLIIENPKSKIAVKDARNARGPYPFFTSGDAILSYPHAIIDRIDQRNCFLNDGGNADIKFYVGKAAYSSHTWCIHANEFSDYLFLLLLNLKQELQVRFFHGSTLKNLQTDSLKKHPIYIPTPNEIESFNKIVVPLLTLRSLNMQNSRQLEELRDFLLPLLMSNQCKVSLKNLH
ncbi:Type I restriction enzyme S protein HdsS [Helicobacter sp. NHP21005]|uniref:restriction endonuclease subunit S n=1 Tax=Helicobacter felistomachi TaxID=3040201 RepID=UPI002573AF6F|nr:restriction endonuclease subunit S [Helicobacter sp. NHP21005]BEG57357.1 Type I restriction enzyme S protein HdsS [Helicobacter sp. NHP21005]